MLLLTRLDAGTSTLYAYAAMFVLGLGLGLVMQVLVLAVQNAVDYAELGVATSGASLFRSMGGSLGTAALGAVFTARLTDELAGTPPARQRRRRQPRGVQRLPAASATRYTGAFSDALSTVFLVAAVILAVAFLLSWLIEERPLRQTRRDGRRRRGLRHPVERRLAARADRASSPAWSAASARRRSSSAPSRPGIDLPPGPAGCSSRPTRASTSATPTRSPTTARSTRRGCAQVAVLDAAASSPATADRRRACRPSG